MGFVIPLLYGRRGTKSKLRLVGWVDLHWLFSLVNICGICASQIEYSIVIEGEAYSGTLDLSTHQKCAAAEGSAQPQPV